MTRYVFKNVAPIRSKTMRAIRSKNTSIELLLRKELSRRRVRYRLHYNRIPGKPDIVFPKQRLAVFCDSEFWHGRNWLQKEKTIRSNRTYWIEKINRNIARDNEVNAALIRLGWKVLRFWEKDIQSRLQEVVAAITYNLR